MIKLTSPLKKGHEERASVEEIQLCKTVLAQPAIVGIKQIEVVDTVGCKAGQFLVINGDGGDASEINGPVKSVDGNVMTLTDPLEKKHSAQSPVEEVQVCKTVLAKPGALGATSIEVEDAGGCKAGAFLLINEGNETEISGPIKAVLGNVIQFTFPLKKNHTVEAPVEETEICRTVLAMTASIAATQVEVEDSEGCRAGSFLLINGHVGDKSEVNGPVKAVDGNTITLTVPLMKRHEMKAPVEETQYRPDAGNCVKLPEGTAGCPAGTEVSSKEECEECADELKLHRQAPWEGANALNPSGCSWRERDLEDLHWNAASVGSSRLDLAPICRIMHTSEPTAAPTATPTPAPTDAPTMPPQTPCPTSETTAAPTESTAAPTAAKASTTVAPTGSGASVVLSTASSWEQLAGGTVCKLCSEIQSIEECKQAHDALGLHREETFIGATPMIPIGCSWRDRQWDDFHWNTASTGRPRLDLHPLCRKTEP
jgi:cell division septation protein DedD